MAGGIIGLAAVAAYFGIAHIGEPDQGGGSIAGQVQIAPNLADQVKPTDVLFVIVRRPTGPPRPIAAKRFDGPKFPVQFEITNDDVMVKGSDVVVWLSGLRTITVAVPGVVSRPAGTTACSSAGEL